MAIKSGVADFMPDSGLGLDGGSGGFAKSSIDEPTIDVGVWDRQCYDDFKYGTAAEEAQQANVRETPDALEFR